MRGLFRREKSKQASFELSCRKLTVTVSTVRLHELDNRSRHLAELSISSVQLIGDVDSHVARPALSGIEGYDANGLAVSRSSKRPPAVCRAAFRDQNLFALKRPLSPGVAILYKVGRVSCSVRTFRCEIYAGVLSRSLFVDQANIAAPQSVNFT